MAAIEEKWNAVAEMAKNWVNETGPGISIAVAKGDDEPFFVSAGDIRYNFGETPPKAGPDTLWRMYSMTKPITAMAAIALIEDGRLDLDDPVSKYFPEFAEMKVLDLSKADWIAAENDQTHVLRLDGNSGDIVIKVDRQEATEARKLIAADKPITVRHLVTHTAGLGYSLLNFADPFLAVDYFSNGLNPFQVDGLVELFLRRSRQKPLIKFAQELAKQPLLAQPGTLWSYSVGLDLLAAVIEVVASKIAKPGAPYEYETYVQDRLFTPLGITSATSGYWTVPKSERARLSTMYSGTKGRTIVDRSENSQWLEPPSFPYGGAGLVMSARDYDKFARMLLNLGKFKGVQVLTQNGVKLAMSNLLPKGTDTHLLEKMFNMKAGSLGYGAGGSVLLQPDPGAGRGAGTYGWGGAAGTVFWVDTTKQVRASAMINRFTAVGLLDEPLIEAVYRDLNH